MKRTFTVCPYCGTGCMFHLLSLGRRLVGVEPSRIHPISRGGLCVKGWNAFSFVGHPDRLTVPLVRKSGQLVPVSWEDALERVVAGLRSVQEKHGKDSIMFASSAKATNEENFLLMKLARRVFGTNNIDHCARLCHSSTVVGLAETFGSGAMTNSIDCIDKADLIFVIGSNTTEQHPLIGSRIINAARNGARLIVADNRIIRLARHADMHLRHRNGSDVALLMAMTQVIISEGLEDRAFIDSRTEGFIEFVESIREWTPERAARLTGLTAAEIAEAASFYAAAKSAMIFFSMGITQHTHGVDNVRCIANLAMLTGNVGREGTGVNPLRGQNNVQGGCDMGALPDLYSGYQKVAEPAVREKFANAWGGGALPEVPGLPLTLAMNAAAHGGIKGMFFMGENPVLSDPDQAHALAALRSLDLLVVQDIFLTETAQLADIVLPAACFAEKDGTFTNTERRIQLLKKAVDPPGEAKADWEILCGVAAAAGFDGMKYESPSAVMAEVASLTHGIMERVPLVGGPENRPALIVFGKSMFLHPEPIRELRACLNDIPNYSPLVMYDGAHVLGILGSLFQDPLTEGAEIVTGSTHKTFWGPQRGIIASKMPDGAPFRKLWTEIVARTFPGATSNHHLGTQLAMLAATIEMNAFKDAYQAQVLSNARAFARACAVQGIPVEGGEAEGYTHTHQVIIRVSSFGDAKEIASRLEANNIITNYQALPGDETFYHPSGIRMGVQEMTRFGMKEPDFEGLARFIAGVVLKKNALAAEVAEFRKKFSSMEYCLTAEQTLRLAPRLLESVFADPSYAHGFAEALRNAG